MKPVLYTLLIFMLCTTSSIGRIEVQQFETPEQEARYKKLVNELRCLVCQNQNLADSNADLARTLREMTYTMILDGKTNEEIIQYMVERYGDFVLYRPPLRGQTIILWAGPFILLLLATGISLLLIRRNRLQPVELGDRDLSQTRLLLNDSRHEDG